MSYGVALRNGVPFTLGTIAALCTNATGSAWSPLSLWPDGISSAGMWISPRTLTSEWQDYTGTTPVAVPGTVADSSNPVGLALDIRAGATVLTDPGNHMLQATSTARPLLSARVNLFVDSEIQNGGNWNADSPANYTITPNAAMAPDGTMTAAQLEVVLPNWASASQVLPAALLPEVEYTMSFWGKVPAGTLAFTSTLSGSGTFTTEWQEFVFSGIGAGYGRTVLFNLGGSPTVGQKVYFCKAQITASPAKMVYQSVNVDGTAYSTGFPIYQKYDGVDDDMATATFAAGTLINGMDCLIAVRRDSAAACVAGLYNGIADATKFFGMAESASGSGCVGSGAGTPTVWVDGAQLSGGTAVTRGTLHTALTVGDYHILEFRGLDLSTWTAAGFGLYTSYLFPGARGDIMLFDSTASTTDKDAARQYLADYYGVTLP